MEIGSRKTITVNDREAAHGRRMGEATEGASIHTLLVVNENEAAARDQCQHTV